MNKKDYVLIGGLLLAALLLFFAVRLIYNDKGNRITVTVKSEEYLSLPLNEDTTLTIPGANGLTCTLIVEDGEAFVEKADCPDKICVNHNRISKMGEAIICLPARIVITVDSDELPDIDAISQ